MSTLIYLIVGSACAAFYLVNVVKWQYIIEIEWKEREYYPLNFKPINCEVCLAAWLGLLSALVFGFEYLSIPAMFVSGVLSIFITKYLNS
jgi:amino acid transporter